MNHPNTFLIQRKALARFRKSIPFLALIPPPLYQKLSPFAWYEPFGEIEQARRALEKQLDSYVMLYKRYGHEPAWETQLFVHIHEASLTPKQQAVLNTANELFLRLGIKAEAYQKPLRLRSSPLEHPLIHCTPPDADDYQGFSGMNPDDEIPF